MEFDLSGRRTEIVTREGGIEEATAADLVKIGQTETFADTDGEEGVSTRLLIYAAKLLLK